MRVGNVYYITTSYNEEKFHLLLENHLKNKRKGDPLSDELIEECIAALLEYKNSISELTDVSKMENLLTKININFSDCRNFSSKVPKGNPLDAIKAFNMLL